MIRRRWNHSPGASSSHGRTIEYEFADLENGSHRFRRVVATVHPAPAVGGDNERTRTDDVTTQHEAVNTVALHAFVVPSQVARQVLGTVVRLRRGRASVARPCESREAIQSNLCIVQDIPLAFWCAIHQGRLRDLQLPHVGDSTAPRVDGLEIHSGRTRVCHPELLVHAKVGNPLQGRERLLQVSEERSAGPEHDVERPVHHKLNPERDRAEYAQQLGFRGPGGQLSDPVGLFQCLSLDWSDRSVTWQTKRCSNGRCAQYAENETRHQNGALIELRLEPDT
mmetsp:Transcript_42873/g.118548  ORF Transcript_42873/g.118548 Transcript_42873/m.118548 type:complete len:281 (-) Transcript_42873:8-850(-)